MTLASAIGANLRSGFECDSLISAVKDLIARAEAAGVKPKNIDSNED